MSEVKLLGAWYSPFSLRVEWALKIKGVKYEFIEQDIKNKSQLLLQSNPVYKKIPVLIHDGKTIVESMIILEYIDETFEGPSILPKDPYNRFIYRFWAKFLDDTCFPTLRKALFNGSVDQEKAKEEFGEMLKVLDNEFKDKRLFVGDKFGFADIAANLMAFWLGILEEACGVELVTNGKYPNFCKWREEYINSSQLVKDSLPKRDMLLAYYLSRI